MSKRKINDDDDDDENKYISINTNNKIIYCSQCDSYLIYIKGMTNAKNDHSTTATTTTTSTSCCDNCENPYVQNVYVDDAKIYYDSENITEKTKFIGPNSSNIKRRCYSGKIIKCTDN